MDILAKAGIKGYDPQTAPYSPDLNKSALLSEVYPVDSGKIAGARYFVLHNIAPSNGAGVEIEKATKLNRIPVILFDANIRMSRMQPHRAITLQYTDFEAQAEDFVEVFKLLQHYEPGLGWNHGKAALLGFGEDGQIVDLEELVYSRFPHLKYEYEGEVGTLELHAPNMNELLYGTRFTREGTGEVTMEDPIIDSDMTWEEAVLRNINPECPVKVFEQQAVVNVKYKSFDGLIHQGQMVVDKRLEEDIQTVFQFILDQEFPIEQVVPVSHPSYLKDGKWDDYLSMLDDNSSGFNYRYKTNSITELSNHSFGTAIDVNPYANPYIKGVQILPPSVNGYDETGKTAGTLTADSPIVKLFKDLGWQWSGDWDPNDRVDYQHFEKKLPPL